MKNCFSVLGLVAAGLIILPASSNAVTITQTATGLTLVAYNDTITNFSAFDSTLGTLNSVTFSVDSVSVGGSWMFTQGSVGSSTIQGIQSTLYVYQGDQGQPGILYNGLSSDLVSSPATLSVSNKTLPLGVARNTSATFTFTSGQSIITQASPLTITLTQAGDIADYIGTSSSSAPEFTLNLDINPFGSIGGGPSYGYSGVTSQANVTLKYNYTPAAVPEPSTYGFLLGALALAAVVVRRRQFKS